MRPREAWDAYRDAVSVRVAAWEAVVAARDARRAGWGWNPTPAESAEDSGLCDAFGVAQRIEAAASTLFCASVADKLSDGDVRAWRSGTSMFAALVIDRHDVAVVCVPWSLGGPPYLYSETPRP